MSIITLKNKSFRNYFKNFFQKMHHAFLTLSLHSSFRNSQNRIRHISVNSLPPIRPKIIKQTEPKTELNLKTWSHFQLRIGKKLPLNFLF